MRKQLYILCALGTQQFAVEGRQLREILSWQPLRPLPLAPPFVAGVLTCRGQMLPVLDLGLLLYRQPVRHCLSSRILVTTYTGTQGEITLGLLAERVTDAIRRSPACFQPNTWRAAQPPGLAIAALLEDAEYGPLCLLDLRKIVAPEAAEQLWQAREAG